jgi:antimicrobial peptide system SdpB family protein
MPDMQLSVLNRFKLRLQSKADTYFRFCYKVSNRAYFTNVYGLARSILALGTLLTLGFNSIDNLYARHMFEQPATVLSVFDQLNLFHLFEFETLWIPKIISILILSIVFSGFYPRITGLLHWWVSFSFCTSATIVDGGDQITAVLTFLLIPITLLDDRRNHWVNDSTRSVYRNFIAFFIFFFIELQVAVVYLQSAIFKPIRVNEWNDGTAIYYWFNHNMFGAPDWMLHLLRPVFDRPSLLITINWGVILFETLLFAAFFMTKNRKFKLLKYAILFHLGILLVHGLVSFFFAMTGALILFLYPKNKDISEFAAFGFIHRLFKTSARQMESTSRQIE